jgi:hypothetical protein
MSDKTPLQRPRGRPKADESSTRVSSWVRDSEYDRLVKMANQREQSVSKLVRSLLMMRLK